MTYYKSLPKIENEKSLSSKHNLEDKLMKQVSEKEINILLARLRIPIKIVKLLNTELIYKDIEKRTDFIGLTENNELINIEFQSTKLKKEDHERFGTYTLLTRIKQKKCSKTIVISTPQLNNQETLKYQINSESYLNINVYTLKDEDGDKLQNELINKIENKEEFKDKEVIEFILCILMSTKQRIPDLITKNLKYMGKIKTSKENKEFIESMMFLLISKFVTDENERKILWRELKMRIKLVDEIYESGKIEGKEEGIKEGQEKEKIKIAKKLIKQNLTKEQIIKATNITEKQLLTLLKI